MDANKSPVPVQDDPGPSALRALRPQAPRRRLGLPRLLIIGCGDIGLGIVARLQARFRVLGTVTSEASADRVRAAGAVPLLLDLDTGKGKTRIGALSRRVLVLAPTSPTGTQDQRVRRLLATLCRPADGPSTMVYISTSGVYGDRAGAWTCETTPPAPANERACRRLDAERRVRASAWRGAVLRVPGIYGPGRMPLERLRQGLPVPPPEQDIYTNHIHTKDLERACIAALFRANPARVYNIVDDTQLTLGQYLDRVADIAGLPRPPRANWEQVRSAVGAQRMSFMSESRRLRNARMKRELRLHLRYPDVAAGLVAQASKSLSTER